MAFKKRRFLTVGELKKIIENVDDNIPIVFDSLDRYDPAIGAEDRIAIYSTKYDTWDDYDGEEHLFEGDVKKRIIFIY